MKYLSKTGSTNSVYMTSLVGQNVFLDHNCLGRVEKEFICTWGKRKGMINSIQVSGMDVKWRKIHIPGILYFSVKKRKWINKLNINGIYSVRK